VSARPRVRAKNFSSPWAFDGAFPSRRRRRRCGTKDVPRRKDMEKIFATSVTDRSQKVATYFRAHTHTHTHTPTADPAVAAPR
jgi:hypothetical protein